MTLFIKPCRIIDPQFESTDDNQRALGPSNLIEFESNVSLEDAEIPLMAIVINRLNSNDSEAWLLRPRDFEKARDWIFDTTLIARADKPQLITLLNTMEDDPEIYVHLSW